MFVENAASRSSACRFISSSQARKAIAMGGDTLSGILTSDGPWLRFSARRRFWPTIHGVGYPQMWS
jgi:hypothetical protein